MTIIKSAITIRMIDVENRLWPDVILELPTIIPYGARFIAYKMGCDHFMRTNAI